MHILAFRDVFHSRVKSQLVLEESFVDFLLAAYWTREHLLFEGPPGTGKTSLAETLGQMLGDYGRIQMTPETLPSDILGMEILKDREAMKFEFRQGPIFHSLLIVDEINRATPRTQSALLQAMQEGKVQVGDGEKYLPEDFLVIATLNPTQMDGTFILPDSQLDRFGLCLKFNQLSGELFLKALLFNPSDVDDSQVEVCPKYQADEIPSEWLRVCSAIQDQLEQDQANASSVRPLGIRVYKTWLKLGYALSRIRGHDHLSTKCLRELLGPVFIHRFGPFLEEDYLSRLLKVFDRQTGA